MRAESVLRLARYTRPVMRYKTPGLYRITKWMVAWLCPRGKPGQEQRLVAPFDGGRIHIDTSSTIEYHLLFRGCHESAVTDLLLQTVKPGAVCIDVGANVGAHALVMARCAGPEGHVLALEPHPRICQRLRDNVALNRYDQVTVIEAALTERDGAATLYGFSEDAFQQGTSSLLPDAEVRREMTVQTISGNTLLAEHRISACDVIKIDVEGAEAIVLRELWDLIARHTPLVVFEYDRHHWGKFGASLEEWPGKLRDARYRLHTIRKNNTRPFTGTAPDTCEILCEPGP